MGVIDERLKSKLRACLGDKSPEELKVIKEKVSLFLVVMASKF